MSVSPTAAVIPSTTPHITAVVTWEPEDETTMHSRGHSHQTLLVELKAEETDRGCSDGLDGGCETWAAVEGIKAVVCPQNKQKQKTNTCKAKA